MHCFPLEYGWFIRSYTLRENWLSLFQKLSLANICSVQIRTSCPILQFMLGFSLVWAFIQVLCLLSWRVWVHMKGCSAVSRRNWFLVAIQHLWYFNPLCSLFNSDSCMLGEKCEIHMFHLWLSIQVAVASSLYFCQLWVSVLTTMYYK